MIRQPIAVEEVLKVLGGSFATVGEAEVNGCRHVDLEGPNGRQVQIVSEIASGKIDAWLMVMGWVR
jgi:hypothetical protein